MLRGRIGGTGPQFNVGEVTVTRCSVQIGERIGHAWVRGGNARHAELAACADALLQDTDQHPHLHERVLVPLRQSLQARREAASRKAAASKVEFFTVVRGE
jgi:alpha-D-ribose 1-methylphosphonate 5-triphosphate synthase subunit PhnG